MKTLVICSGGLDSVTLAHKVAAEHNAHAPCVLRLWPAPQKGARLRRGLRRPPRCAARHHRHHRRRAPLDRIGADRAGTLSRGHYAEETMRITVVPNRNAIMLAIAFGVAAAAAGRGGGGCRPWRRPLHLPGLPPGLHRALRDHAAPCAGGYRSHRALHSLRAAEQSRHRA